MYVGKRVRLKSVDNKQSKPTCVQIRDYEDYWRLIGCEGEIISDEIPSWSKDKRFLVRFDQDLIAMKLECHNELSNPLWSNALWIRVSDLEII
ncbi:hypothetical protein [Stenoxybacter acetivorans]|uniref:hypothetical protein n=1 Tax=Stenoxybacter acetivorans TaxID=422441 RepID=UPI00056CE1D1|nr:hypothetical protein [Stenoxybacter acetivorans]